MNIAFDLDGVLIDIFHVLRLAVMEETGKDIGDIDNCATYSFANLHNTELDKCLAKTYPYFRDFEPVKGAYRLLKAVPKPVYIVTARLSKYATDTCLAFEHHFRGIPYRIAFTNGHENKEVFLNGYDYFVEDRGETALYLAEKGVTVFLLDKKYNKGFKHNRIKRVKSLGEILKAVVR